MWPTPDPTYFLLNDVTLGCYTVDLDMGPSYSTARAEAQDGMESLMKAAPAVAPLILDLYARAQNWPEANEIAAVEVM